MLHLAEHRPRFDFVRTVISFSGWLVGIERSSRARGTHDLARVRRGRSPRPTNHRHSKKPELGVGLISVETWICVVKSVWPNVGGCVLWYNWRMKMKRKLGFFGAGKMAEGIVQAVAAVGTMPLGSIVMAETFPARAAEMAKRYGVQTTPDATVENNAGI